MAFMGGLGYWYQDFLAFAMMEHATFISTFLGTALMSRFCCRRRYTPRRFLTWVLVWTPLLSGLFWLIACLIIVCSTPGYKQVAYYGRFLTLDELPAVLLEGIVGGAAALVLLSPFLVLMFRCPFFREQFEVIFRFRPSAQVLEERSDAGETAEP